MYNGCGQNGNEGTNSRNTKRKGNGCGRGWCVRRGSLLQDHLPVKFKDPKFKHEIRLKAVILLKLFHNLFAINFFSVVEIIIELFVVCQKLIHVYA